MNDTTRCRAESNGWLAVRAPGQETERVYVQEGDEVTIEFEPDGGPADDG